MEIRLRRIYAFERALAERRATRVVPTPYGAAVLNDDLPIVHDLNRILGERPVVAADEMIEDATNLFTPLGRHARVDVFGDAIAERVAPAFALRDWGRSEWLLMARDTVVEGLDPTIREVAPETVFSFDEQTARLDYDAETSRQLAARTRLTFDVMQAHGFARFVDGVPVTMCRLYLDGKTACIDSLDTLAEHRGRGYARAAITTAIAAAAAQRADLIFLLVEPDNTATRLYERLGFQRVGTITQFDAPEP